MNKNFLAMTIAAALVAGSAIGGQTPVLQLPPATPAAAAQAGALSPATPPSFPAPAQSSAAPPSSAPVPAPSAQATPVAVQGVAPAPTGEGIVTPAAGAKPRAARPAAARKPSATRDPYADIPVPVPAKEAIRRSESWAGNSSAIVAGGSDGRVVFVFGETMPTVVCAPLRMCDIELQPGEQVMDQPHIGDAVRWNVSPGITGSGEKRQTHVIVKPGEAGLDTNLLIPTNRRMYRLRLVSSEKNYVSVVAFSYPEDDKAAWDMAIAQQAGEEQKVVAELPSTSVDALDFNYGITVKRGRPRWKPVRVFTDGSRTYIQLPAGATEQDAPAVVALAPDGTEQLVNFRMRGGYVMVDRVLGRAALISGLDGQAERVEIEHGCAKRSVFGNCKG